MIIVKLFPDWYLHFIVTTTIGCSVVLVMLLITAVDKTLVIQRQPTQLRTTIADEMLIIVCKYLCVENCIGCSVVRVMFR